MSVDDIDSRIPLADQGFVAPDSIKTESWLNPAREKAYASMNSGILEAAEGTDNHGELLGDVLKLASSPAFNYDIRYERRMTAEDRAHISCQRLTPELSSEVAGQPIERVVFIVDDDVTYAKLEEIFDKRPGSSHGFNLPGMVFTDHPEWREASLLISKARGGTIEHEVQHSIDPAPDRTGYDRMLEEMFAYAANCRTEAGIDWQELANSVADPEYFKKYSATLREEDRVSLPDWRKRVGIATVALRDMASTQGEVVALQKLGKMRKVDELLIEWSRSRPQK